MATSPPYQSPYFRPAKLPQQKCLAKKDLLHSRTFRLRPAKPANQDSHAAYPTHIKARGRESHPTPFALTAHRMFRKTARQDFFATIRSNKPINNAQYLSSAITININTLRNAAYQMRNRIRTSIIRHRHNRHPSSSFWFLRCN